MTRVRSSSLSGRDVLVDRSAGRTDRADLRRRPGPQLDAEGPRRPAPRSTSRRPSSSIGSQAARHPDLVRRMVARRPRARQPHLHPPRPLRGLRLAAPTGSSTLTRPRSPAHRPLPRLVRPPYSATPDAVDRRGRAGARRRSPARLPDRARRLRHGGLEPARRRRDRRHAARRRRAGRDRDDPRRWRRPEPDRRGARPADPAAAGTRASGSSTVAALAGLRGGRHRPRGCGPACAARPSPAPSRSGSSSPRARASLLARRRRPRRRPARARPGVAAAPRPPRAAASAAPGHLPPVSVIVPAYNEAVGIERRRPLARRERLPESR